MKRLVLILVFAGLCLSRAEQIAWQPGKTWVFAVGVLKFDDSSLESWPDKGREDAVMIAAMQKRGVPADHILFLRNEQATKENITRKFAPFLRQAKPDDTLFFYYAGHGGRDYSKTERTCTFVTYDTESSWTVPSVFDTVEENFHGAQVVYLADCCHSGGLVAEAARHRGRSAVLASAHVSSDSTGNWTFTHCLAEMFRGNPLLDANGDGRITFNEAAGYIEGEMAFLEDQHAAHSTAGGFAGDIEMARASGKRKPMMGDHVEAESKRKWRKAEVSDVKGGKILVTWPGRERSSDEWLPPGRIRAFTQKTWPVGTLVQAEWGKEWYPARIVKAELGLHLIHYDGFPDGDDEWMGLSRLKKK